MEGHGEGRWSGGCRPDYAELSPVKAFNISILIRFSGLNVKDCHADGFSPGNELAIQKLRAVVDP